MRIFSAMGLAASLFVIGCGGSSTPSPQPDLSPALPVLTVNNTLSWCSITVKVGSAATVTETGMTGSYPAAAGTTVVMTATPKGSFFPVQWTGTATVSDSTQTYTMTSAGSQTVTACCGEGSIGGGC